MKTVIQRVKNAGVSVEGKISGFIDHGLLVYLGVALNDTEKDAIWLAEKIPHLRIFDDVEGKMNLSLVDICNTDTTVNAASGVTADVNERPASRGILVISQFTLLGDARKGRRPSWGNAAPPEKAKALYDFFIGKIRDQGIRCESGVFRAHMEVSYTNDGPVTILLDSGDFFNS